MNIVADEQLPFVKHFFGQAGELVLKPGRQIQPKDLCNADILLVRSVTQVNPALLHQARLRFVGSLTAGADHLDLPYLQEAGIDYALASGFNAPPVADYVLAVLAAAWLHKVLEHPKERLLKAAVIGVGHVGHLVVSRLQALGFEVLCVDPLRAETEKNFHSVALREIEEVDLISLHVPLTKQGAYPTYQFINQDFFNRQKPGCLLINASRGAVINTADLLATGQHLRTCLDVFEHEPWIPEDLWKQAWMITPHIAGYSIQSKIRGMAMLYHALCEKKIINHQIKLPVMRQKELKFFGRKTSFSEVILSIFDPYLTSQRLHDGLDYQDKNQQAIFFDTMRQEFNERDEFEFVTIRDAQLSSKDQAWLKALGLLIE